MKTDLVPIRFTWGRNEKGAADYPAFNSIPSDIRQGLKWSNYFDVHGSGMHYDKVDNLGTGHDRGTACVLVPEDFALAAAELLPEVEIIDEAAFEMFWDGRSKVDLPEDDVDAEVLQGIIARMDLEERLGITPTPELTQRRRDAIDPTKRNRGVKKNMMKRWADAKRTLNLEIHEDYRKP